MKPWLFILSFILIFAGCGLTKDLTPVTSGNSQNANAGATTNSGGSPGGDPTLGTSDPNATYTYIAGVISSNCISCHGAGSNNGALTTYAQVLAKVVANDYVSSPLYQVIENQQMPPGNPLPSSYAVTIAGWINKGAPND